MLENYDKILLEHNQATKGISNFRYLAFEDMEHKCWVFYDSKNPGRLYLDFEHSYFGNTVLEMVNMYKVYCPENPQHERYIEGIKSVGASDEHITFMEGLSKECQEQLGYLSEFLSSYEYHKKEHPGAFNDYIVTMWKKYRSCIHIDVWKRILTKDSSEDDKKQEMYLLDKLVSKYICAYHDIVSFVFPFTGQIMHGRVFCVEHKQDIFKWDLWHILCGDAKVPHVCVRCGQFYASNNNKTKYCEECQKDSKKIHNENRRNSLRYLHKKIQDKWNKYDKDKSKKFTIESNYYYAIVQGKRPKVIPEKYNPKIKTKKQYIKWLESYLQ